LREILIGSNHYKMQLYWSPKEVLHPGRSTWPEAAASAVSLGPHIMRTETASLYVLSVLQYEWMYERKKPVCRLQRGAA